MSFQQSLYDLIRLEFIVGDAKDLKGLLAGNKPSLNSQTLLSNLLATLVAEFLHCAFRTLLMKILKHFFSSLVGS